MDYSVRRFPIELSVITFQYFPERFFNRVLTNVFKVTRYSIVLCAATTLHKISWDTSVMKFVLLDVHFDVEEDQG